MRRLGTANNGLLIALSLVSAMGLSTGCALAKDHISMLRVRDAGEDASAPRGKKNSDEPMTWCTEKQPNGHRWVKCKMLIKASPEVVWTAIHNEHSQDADLVYSKVISRAPNDAVSEQKFHHLPIIGTALCVMHTTEVPLKRIDYGMVRSDRFKALEGSWVLTSAVNRAVYLELSSYCDIGIPVPHCIGDSITVKKLEKRLSNVKRASEINQLQIAEKTGAVEHVD